jgi:hypothetical protein
MSKINLEAQRIISDKISDTWDRLEENLVMQPYRSHVYGFYSMRFDIFMALKNLYGAWEHIKEKP